MARLTDKIQNALDESRILVLGTQILLGFQFRAFFEQRFEEFPGLLRYGLLVATLVLVGTFALVLAPGMYHRLVLRGQDSGHLHQVITRLSLPVPAGIATALVIDFGIAGWASVGPRTGVLVAVLAGLAAIGFLYGFEGAERARRADSSEEESSMDTKPQPTPIEKKIKHVLTEARVALPGAQALLGFQMLVILTSSFEHQPFGVRVTHLASLGLVGLSMILLLTPAIYHRVVERGEETEHFHRVASVFVVASTVPLGLGIAGDLFVVTFVVTKSVAWGVGLGAAAAAVMALLWYGFTGARAKTRGPRGARRPAAAAA